MPPTDPSPSPPPDDAHFRRLRDQMVDQQLIPRGIRDPRVLAAMRAVPRHRFMPPADAPLAHDDRPQPIGHDQTISQPYIVARMTELALPEPHHRALDVGTGSGDQAAVLSHLVAEVCSIEILRPLADRAAATLARDGYDNVTVRCGDGHAGWPDRAPFDVIIVAAAPLAIPPALIDQLAPGGRLVIPVGPTGGAQILHVVQKQSDGTLLTFDDGLVRFVPLTGHPA
ncbi:MAG: protein-L-isoaspartate(D-aspartate) O-methyltransferase [Myxococcota bacterium]